jgi:hypothetical protein
MGMVVDGSLITNSWSKITFEEAVFLNNFFIAI